MSKMLTAISAPPVAMDLLQFWWVVIRGLVRMMLPLSADPANRLLELCWGLVFLITTVAATAACAIYLWVLYKVSFLQLRKLGAEAGVNWRLRGSVTDASLVGVELNDQ